MKGSSVMKVSILGVLVLSILSGSGLGAQAASIATVRPTFFVPVSAAPQWAASQSSGFQVKCVNPGTNPKYTPGSLEGIAVTQAVSSTIIPDGTADQRTVDGHFVITTPVSGTTAIQSEVVHLQCEMGMQKYDAHGLDVELACRADNNEQLSVTGEIYYNLGTAIVWKGRKILVPCTFTWIPAAR